MNNVTFLQLCFIINPKYWIWVPYIRTTKVCPFQFTFLFLVFSIVHPTIEQAIEVHNKINNLENGTDR